MAYFLKPEELDKLQHAEREDLRSPIPTRIISNVMFGNCNPLQINGLPSATGMLSAFCPL